MEEGQLQYQSPQTARGSNKKFRRFALLLIVIGILLILFFLGKHFFGGSSKKTEVTPTPSSYQFPTDTPTQTPSTTPSLSPTVSATPTSVKTNPVDKTTGLDRSTLSVSVLNGSGVTGAANKASTILKNLGYRVVSTGNADNSNYQNVTIQVTSSKSSFLPLLKNDLSSSYTIGNASSNLSASSSADAVVIIGQ